MVNEVTKKEKKEKVLKFQGSTLRQKYKRLRAQDSEDDVAEQAARDVRRAAEEDAWDQ